MPAGQNTSPHATAVREIRIHGGQPRYASRAKTSVPRKLPNRSYAYAVNRSCACISRDSFQPIVTNGIADTKNVVIAANTSGICNIGAKRWSACCSQ